jgi:hypothetical protein
MHPEVFVAVMGAVFTGNLAIAKAQGGSVLDLEIHKFFLTLSFFIHHDAHHTNDRSAQCPPRAR